MLPEYITTILWHFAFKCYEDRMNNLVHCADGWNHHPALLGLDAAPFYIKNFHTFGCPCYVFGPSLAIRQLNDSQMKTTSKNGFVRWTFTLTGCKHFIDS
jgi:hypothetical protein